MEKCRLCGSSSISSNPLVASIHETNGLINFHDLINYYCQIELNLNPSLPSRVCKCCAEFITKITEFINKVQKTQLDLQSERDAAVRIDDSRGEEGSGGKKIKLRTVEDTECILIKEPASETIKLTDVTQEFFPTEAKKSLMLSRRKSVYFQFTITNLLTKIEEVFGSLMPSDLSEYDSIDIEVGRLKVGGEVPAEWLKKFGDFTTWEDLKFTTNCKCGKDSRSFYDLLAHECEIPRLSRSISCGVHGCDKVCLSNAFQSSILNHMSKKHFDFLKFCCVVCSKVYFNMPFLLQHYRDEHSSATLVIYPCLQCGLYNFSQQHLISHKERCHGSKCQK